MAILPQAFLFNWRQIDAASDLDRLRLVLSVIPDEPLMHVLEQERGQGRDEYPVRATWNTILAGVVYQHPSVASLRRELRRNGQLRYLCGLDPLLGEDAVPTDSAYSNFLEILMEHREEVRGMFDRLTDELHRELPDLGRRLAVDGKALPSFGKPEKKTPAVDQAMTPTAAADPAQEGRQKAAAEQEPDRRRDHDANWGVKSYRGKRPDGTAWEKVVTWFGFELHLLVDSQHELPLNYKVTQASAPETVELLPLVEETRGKHPEIIARAEELAADKGYDSAENNRRLYDDYGIRPFIDKRSDWKDRTDATRVLFADRCDTVVHDVRGTISCICPATEEQRQMAYWGFEPERGTLKYRCPAAAYDFQCQGRAQCPGAQTDYGKIVRIDIDTDRRMFTPVARDSAVWERAYDRRTAIEQVNSRLDRVLGFEQHTIRGLKKMETRVGIALVVMLAMALGRIRIGQQDQMRSLLAPVIRSAA